MKFNFQIFGILHYHILYDRVNTFRCVATFFFRLRFHVQCKQPFCLPLMPLQWFIKTKVDAFFHNKPGYGNARCLTKG